eukprot:Blabericola_migrator_1__3726@NODE_2115_length_3248_cov_139_331342_g1340_i0_p2_GENE_NODE_2115_length_3248_cov_139_331342_g1340_i0NODE_2115_length_3248_cov_139_331342_g1340_i0_p2_ORF_typecomplete_len259_score22_51_NODE_2115_length_3248_cov_139_331342_g1340_i024713166
MSQASLLQSTMERTLVRESMIRDRKRLRRLASYERRPPEGFLDPTPPRASSPLPPSPGHQRSPIVSQDVSVQARLEQRRNPFVPAAGIRYETDETEASRREWANRKQQGSFVAHESPRIPVDSNNFTRSLTTPLRDHRPPINQSLPLDSPPRPHQGSTRLRPEFESENRSRVRASSALSNNSSGLEAGYPLFMGVDAKHDMRHHRTQSDAPRMAPRIKNFVSPREMPAAVY